MLRTKKVTTLLLLLLTALSLNLIDATPTEAQSTGTIIIVQDTVPNAAQNFSFSIGGSLSPATFRLDDDNTNNLSNTRTYNNFSLGNWSCWIGCRVY